MYRLGHPVGVQQQGVAELELQVDTGVDGTFVDPGQDPTGRDQVAVRRDPTPPGYAPPPALGRK